MISSKQSKRRSDDIDNDKRINYINKEIPGTSTGICRYNANHRMPKNNLEAHESTCALRCLGYAETDELLPDPPNEEAHTLVKFSNNQIQQIIKEAAYADPLFKKGSGGVTHQPLSLSRLQLVYTADERRALHDAVVAAVPSCHDLRDLALASSNEDDKQGNVVKSRVEILAELRNMKRRRTKYRVAAKTKNYSDVLRDVIKTQMESYTEAVSSTLPMTAEENLQSQGRDSAFNKERAKSNFSINKDGKYNSVKFRDNKAERREVSVTRKGTFDVQFDESRQREENFRKETSIKRHESRYHISDNSKRHESHRDRDRNKDRDKEHNVEKPNERYRSEKEYYESRRSHGSSHRHKSRSDEENAHRRESTDEGNNKSVKRRTYDYDDRHSESRYYKEDKYRRDKIKNEPNERSRESNSKNSHQSDKKSERSRSRDRHRDIRKRKHGDEDYRKYGEQSKGKHKRYYDVLKEDPKDVE